MVDRLEIPKSFQTADNAILLSRVKDGVQPLATWNWLRAMYLFLLQACHDLKGNDRACTEQVFTKFVLNPENWVPLPNFLEVNENRIREGDPNVAKVLRLAIYRELSCFQEAYRLLDREAPPVAANETVVSEGSARLLFDTRVVPSVNEV